MSAACAAWARCLPCQSNLHMEGWCACIMSSVTPPVVDHIDPCKMATQEQMPRRTDGRGGGAKRGRGAKPHPGDARSKAKKPHQEASAGPGSGVLAGVGVADRVVPAPVRVVKARNMGGLGEGSRALILQMMHQLRLQDEEDERQRQQEEAQEGSAAGGASGPEKQVKRAAASVPKASRMSAQQIAALEASLLASGDKDEEDDAGDGSSTSDDEEEGGDDEQLDGTFRRAANFLANGKAGSSSGSSEEEEEDEGSSSSEEEDEGAEAVAGAGASQPQPTKKLSQRDQEMLLKTLIKDERKAYVAEQQAAWEAAIEAAVARKARGGGGTINSKVRVTLTAEKGGAQKLVVLERKKTLDGLLAVAKSKLRIKKPLRAYLADSRAAVENTLLLADDVVVVVTDRAKEAEEEGGEERRRRKGKQKWEDKEQKGKPPAAPVDHEAELDVVKEAYKLRTEDRYDNGGPKRGEGAEEESARLKAALEERQASARFDEMRAQREGLPASRLRDEIVRAVDGAQVVVVEGETGSGKTTQVPQFILDDWIARGQGAECSIVCTQPRRISAIGVAERVASERLEAVGQTVGYQIRLESRRSARTRLLFCTTGILLRRLMGDPELAGVSHIIVDEVHERSIESDFLLIILRDLMRRRPALKVVLMSATIEASLFSNYMGGCPCLHIPGRTHPVQVLYLGHIADMLEGGAAAASVAAFQSAARGGGEFKREQRKGGKGKGAPSLPPPRAQQQQKAGGNANGEEGEDGQDAERALAETFGAEEAQRLKTQLSARSDRIPIDYDLIVRLTRHVVEREAAARARGGGGGRGGDGKGGAVLVFLPGFAEIERAMGQMRRDPVLGDQGRARLFPLHSSVPTAAQKSVFRRLPEGVCKVVVATNIAETSITIDDISYVIDSCRVKETAFDPHTRMSSLREVWVSKAAASQRAGRAGRVRPGTCFRLVPEEHFQRALLDYTLPEIRRTTLEDLVLRVLMLELGQPKDFLGKAIQPPSDRAVDAAIRTLEEIEAVHIRPADGHIILRPLGFHLAALPLDVRLGKMLIISCIFDCLEPMLTVAAALSGKSVFTLPPGKREEAWLAKQRFADAKSDHLALVEVWKAWSRVKDEGWQAKKEFVRQNYLSMSALESLEAVRNQIRNDLVACGFAEPLSPEQQQQQQRSPKEIDYRANEYDVPLLKCILVAGLAPQIAKFVRPARGQGAHFVVRDGTKVFIHPGSVNAKRVREAGPGGREALALYHRKVETTRVYLHDTTFVSSLALLLFGTHVRIRREHGGVASKSTMVVMDAWIGFKMREESSVLLKVLKSKVDEVLLLKISRPYEDHVRRLRPVVSTIRKLLHAEVGEG